MASVHPGFRVARSVRRGIRQLREPMLLEGLLRARHVHDPYEKIDIHIPPEAIDIERARDRRTSQEDVGNSRARKGMRYVDRDAISRHACPEPTSRVNDLRVVAELHSGRLQHKQTQRSD